MQPADRLLLGGTGSRVCRVGDERAIELSDGLLEPAGYSAQQPAVSVTCRGVHGCELARMCSSSDCGFATAQVLGNAVIFATATAAVQPREIGPDALSLTLTSDGAVPLPEHAVVALFAHRLPGMLFSIVQEAAQLHVAPSASRVYGDCRTSKRNGLGKPILIPARLRNHRDGRGDGGG